VAERLTDPAVHKRLAVDLARMSYDDELRTALERSIVNRATQHEAQPFYRLRSSPGVGNILALVMRYASHASRRVPSVPDGASYGRLVHGAKESAGTRYGTSGTKLGHADLTGAFSAAAVLGLRNHEPGQKSGARVETTPDQGKALTLLAHKRARAVDARLKRATVFDLNKLLQA
jgi:transposase